MKELPELFTKLQQDEEERAPDLELGILGGGGNNIHNNNNNNNNNVVLTMDQMPFQVLFVY